MLELISKWYKQYFSNEQAMVLLVFLIIGFVIVVTVGNVLAPVFASIIIAFLLQGLVNEFTRRGVPFMASVLIVYMIFLGVLAVLLLVVLPLAWKQTATFFNELPYMISKGQEALMMLPEKYPELINKSDMQDIAVLVKTEVGKYGQQILSFSISSLPALITIMVYLVLVPVMVFFLMKDRLLISEWISSYLPSERQVLKEVWAELKMQVANYARGKVIEILLVGGITYIAFFFFGVNYAALLAILVGLSVIIPYIGATIVTIPVVIIGYIQWGGQPIYAWFLVVYFVIQIIDGNVIVPLLFSEAVNLHPVAIILAVLLFGGLGGFWGVFFAIPIATLINAVLHAWPEAKNLAEN